MRHVGRLIAAIVGLATWCVAAATVAYAQLPPDPPSDAPLPPVDSGTSVWIFVLVAVLAALMTIAVVGLVASLRHVRTSRPSRMLHA